jgi:hypothetical protein
MKRLCILKANKLYKCADDSIQFFVICMESQQLQGQLQKQHSVGTVNYFTAKQKQR